MRHVHARGFSLTELMVGIGIMATILAISIPAYTRYRANAQLKANVDQVARALREAHSTATQLADGAVVDRNLVTNVPGGADRFTVYTFRGGIPSQATSGSALYYDDPHYVVVSTSASSTLNWHHPFGQPISPTIHAPTNVPIGAAVSVGSNTLYFQQDGSLYGNQARTLTFTNGDAAYTIHVSPQGTVTVDSPG